MNKDTKIVNFILMFITLLCLTLMVLSWFVMHVDSLILILVNLGCAAVMVTCLYLSLCVDRIEAEREAKKWHKKSSSRIE